VAIRAGTTRHGTGTGTKRHGPAGHDSPPCRAGQCRRADGQARARPVCTLTVPCRAQQHGGPLGPAVARWRGEAGAAASSCLMAAEATEKALTSAEGEWDGAAAWWRGPAAARCNGRRRRRWRGVDDGGSWWRARRGGGGLEGAEETSRRGAWCAAKSQRRRGTGLAAQREGNDANRRRGRVEWLIATSIDGLGHLGCERKG
jgi:hypothetical protein